MTRLRRWLGRGRKPGGGERRAEGAPFVRVASVDEVPPGTGKVVMFWGREVGLFNLNGRVEAIDNICPHSARPIGTLGFDGNAVTCLWHGLTFNLDTGMCPEAPHYRVKKYRVQVTDGEIFLAREPQAGPGLSG